MMRAGDVVTLVELLERAGISVWIDGGWGIDALIGEETRPHDDLDIAIDIECAARAIAILVASGFRLHTDERPVRFVMRDANDRRVDFHPLRFAADGGWQAQPDAADFLYPHDGLSGTGTIGGRTVRCVTAEFQIRCHLGYEADASDFHDMHLLRDRLGLSLPSPYDR